MQSPCLLLLPVRIKSTAPCPTLQGVRTGRSVVHHVVTARDGTRKFLLQLFDGLVVEAVGIPVDDTDKPRLTVCVSSQVGIDGLAAGCLCVLKPAAHCTVMATVAEGHAQDWVATSLL